MTALDRPTVSTPPTVGYHLDHTRTHRRYLFYNLFHTLNIRYRSATDWTIIQRQFDCLVYMLWLLAAAARMPRLLPGRLMFVRRNLLSFFAAKGRCLAGHLLLSLFQFLPQLPILLLELLDSLLQAFDLDLQLLYDCLRAIIHSLHRKRLP